MATYVSTTQPVLVLACELASKLIDQLQCFYRANPRSLVGLVVLLLFILYYRHVVVQKPILFCAQGRFHWFLAANCPTISEYYWPSFWCFNTHLLTSISTFVRGLQPELQYHREYIRTPDGGQISLDWYDPDNGSGNECFRPTNEDDDYLDSNSNTGMTGSLGCCGGCSSQLHQDHSRPIALFLPGLTGSSQAEYIKTIVPMAHRVGYRAVALNYRGLGNMRLLTPRLYCAANDEDLQTALIHLKATNPNSKIIATGISMGGIILGRYLIRTGFEALVDATLLISVCFNFLEVVDDMERGLNVALNQVLTRSLINLVLQHKEHFEHHPAFDLDAVRRCRSIRSFDEAFTIRMFGFRSVSDYYRESSHTGKLACIKRPTLCLNAADDMFAPGASLPVDEVRECSHVAMVVTARGGHIGFMEGWRPSLGPSYYSERLAEQYLTGLLPIPDVRRELF